MKIVSRSFLGADSFVTYPHTNAFASGGRALVYLRRRNAAMELCLFDLEAQKIGLRVEIGAPGEVGNCLWTDVALEAPKVAAVFQNSAWILDLDHPQGWIRVFQPDSSATLDGLCSLSRDGSRLLCRESKGGIHRAIEIDLAGGNVKELFRKDWFANHFHYCPHDENWVAFSHEGPAEDILDRCWIWHREAAPQGRVAFDQASSVPGQTLCVGHERWAFHDVSAYVPAYAVSPAGKRGLYEIFGDGRPARLLWENDVLWHCSMDRTGRYVAVDTTGPFSETKLDDHRFRASVEQHLKTDRERGTNRSDVVILDLRTGKSLPVATVERSRHPYHPHPAISPDGRWVAYNDSNSGCRGVWLAELSLELGALNSREVEHGGAGLCLK